MRSRTPNDVTVGSQRNSGWRDKTIHTRAVPCGDCHQPAGLPCINAAGTPTSNHRSRRTIALRAEREAS